MRGSKWFYKVGVAVLLLFLVVGCTSDNESQEGKTDNGTQEDETNHDGNRNENEESSNNEDDEKEGRESDDRVQPMFAEIDDRPITIQEPVSRDDFEMETIPSETNAMYDLDLQMDDDGMFHVDAHITVENQSEDVWEHLVFYMIPNAFTEENKPKDVEGAAEVNVETVQVEDEDVVYSLDGDTLALELEDPLNDGDNTEVTVSYTFTLPEGGIRFTEIDGNYHLAQFYPMLATYQDGWNKESYIPTGESYHTDFSNFTVTYDIPKAYTVFSSSDGETSEEVSSNTLEMDNIKEFYMAIMETDQIDVLEEEYAGIEVRVIADEDSMYADEYLDIALDSLQFFDEHIGSYPHEQLDVIMMEEDGGMEYPGIVTVMDSIQDVSEVIAHEIAHQWFYGMVTNDAYHDPMVDEGLTQFATYLYLMDANGDVEYDEVLENFQDILEDDYYEDQVIPANLSLDGYEDDQWTYSLSVYSQTTYQLLTLFQEHGEIGGALDFLHDYFDTYQYKQVNADQMINYLINYLDIEDVSPFDEWLEVDMGNVE